MSGGWGSSYWGAGRWGAGGGRLRLVGVIAIRENVVRASFDQPVYFSGVLDPNDASDPERFIAMPVSADARPTTVVLVEIAKVAFAGGSVLDVTLDRPMSGLPAVYRLSVNQLISSTGGLLEPGHTSFQFDGLYRAVPDATIDANLPNRDIANPQTRTALFDPLPVTDDALILGTIPVGGDGDYAFDEGLTNLKKRILRRIITTKGKFAHLPDYGVGLGDASKKLAKKSFRLGIITEARNQILQEPDVQDASITFDADPTQPSVFRFIALVQSKIGGVSPLRIDVPFAVNG